MPGGFVIPFQGMVALVFLGLLARITEMAVLVRWATAHWDELQEPLGFTRKQPPCDTTISRSLAQLSLAEFRHAFACWLQGALADRTARWVCPPSTARHAARGLRPMDRRCTCSMYSSNRRSWRWTNGRWAATKPTSPAAFGVIGANCLASYPALGLLTGDAIFTQRPLLELLKTSGLRLLCFKSKPTQPGHAGCV